MWDKYMRKIRKENGFSLVEMIIVVLLLTIMVGVMYMSLFAGSESWHTTNAQIQLQESLRLTVLRISTELRESGKDKNGASKVTISNNSGVNNSDIITFSIPILCESSGSIIDDDGNVAHWGAPLIWGCHDSACMDADNDCASTDYDQISYSIDANNQLVRKVFNDMGVIVRQDVFAQNIRNFQASMNGDETMVTITINAAKTADSNRQVTADNTIEVYLRNRG